MSNTSSTSTARTSRRMGAELTRKCRRLTADGIRAGAFWAAVLIPLAYLPALYVTSGAGFLLALLTLHVACVVIGHEHNHPDSN